MLCPLFGLSHICTCLSDGCQWGGQGSHSAALATPTPSPPGSALAFPDSLRLSGSFILCNSALPNAVVSGAYPRGTESGHGSKPRTIAPPPRMSTPAPPPKARSHPWGVQAPASPTSLKRFQDPVGYAPSSPKAGAPAAGKQLGTEKAAADMEELEKFVDSVRRASGWAARRPRALAVTSLAGCYVMAGGLRLPVGGRLPPDVGGSSTDAGLTDGGW